MQLAGEAGSLLRIEADIADAVAEAKKQWLTRPKAEQLTLWHEDKRPTVEQLGLFDVSGITDEEFWHQAEARVLDLLQTYARHAANGTGLQRQLFADDAARGFAFVDLCRKRFDVVLMNPPFGEPALRAASYVTNTYTHHSHNVLCSFVLRTLCLLSDGGAVGAIVDKTAWVKSSYGNFREHLLTAKRTLTIFADLGWGVLDDAQVETAAFVLNSPCDKSVICLKATGDHLSHCIAEAAEGHLTEPTFVRTRTRFFVVPNCSLAYDLPEDLWKLFLQGSRIEPDLGAARQGLGISDSWRWYRLRSEIPPHLIGRERSYVSLANGGGFAPYYRDLDLLIFWRADGQDIKAEEAAIYRSWSRTVKNVSFYFRAGISFPKRTDALNAHVLPEGCVFTVEGLGFFCDGSEKDLWWALALLNSRLDSYIINAYCGQHKHVGYIKQLPYSSVEERHSCEALAQLAYELKRCWATVVSSSPLFIAPAVLSLNNLRPIVLRDVNGKHSGNAARANPICNGLHETL
jgi:Eco57I restriction-modification methylase